MADKEMSEWEIHEREESKKLADHFSNFVNTMARHPEYFAECVVSEHRTLQQSMFNVFMACIKKWSEQEHFDMRNEFTVKTSKKIMETLDGNIHAPFI